MGSFCEQQARPPSGPSVRVGGFSLIELIVTLVVLSILAAFAIPQITAVINASRITSNANEILVGIQIARTEAIRANVRTSFCQSSNGATCSATSPWRGWVVFADRNGDGVVDAGELVRTGNIEAPIQITSSSNLTNNRINFRPDGLAYQNGNNVLLAGNIRACMPTATPAENARDINIAPGGRASVGPATAVGVGCPGASN